MISTAASHKLNSINGQVFQIKVINWNSFSIGDTTNFKPYVRNGIVKNIKVPKSVRFDSFENALKDFDKFVDPNMGIYDFEKMGDNFTVFASFVALSRFELKNKTRPQNWNETHAKEFTEIVKQVCEEYKKS
jgi:ubiquitin-activating enzyme E1